jgi:hypothetical protein
MLRKIDQKLIAWSQSNNRKPLIVNGAHQVGKSYSILNFAKEHFANYCHIDFSAMGDIASTRRVLNEMPYRVKSRPTIILDLRWVLSVSKACQCFHYFMSILRLVKIWPKMRNEILTTVTDLFTRFLQSRGTQEVRRAYSRSDAEQMKAKLHQSLDAPLTKTARPG